MHFPLQVIKLLKTAWNAHEIIEFFVLCKDLPCVIHFMLHSLPESIKEYEALKEKNHGNVAVEQAF